VPSLFPSTLEPSAALLTHPASRALDTPSPRVLRLFPPPLLGSLSSPWLPCPPLPPPQPWEAPGRSHRRQSCGSDAHYGKKTSRTWWSTASSRRNKSLGGNAATGRSSRRRTGRKSSCSSPSTRRLRAARGGLLPQASSLLRAGGNASQS